MKNILLASQSPRRHEILDLAGISHKIFVSGADEGSVPYASGKPEEYAINTAALKNRAVRAAIEERGVDCEKRLADIGLTYADALKSVVLSADTVVYSDESQKIFGKPADTDEAYAMLRQLSGRAHRVITGVVLHDIESGHSVTFAESTDVFFRDLSDDEIYTYIRTYRPFDKAGAYGIQDGACVFVEKIAGDYFNVVGLPVCRVYKELSADGLF